MIYTIFIPENVLYIPIIIYILIIYMFNDLEKDGNPLFKFNN